LENFVSIDWFDVVVFDEHEDAAKLFDGMVGALLCGNGDGAMGDRDSEKKRQARE